MGDGIRWAPLRRDISHFGSSVLSGGVKLISMLDASFTRKDSAILVSGME